MAGERSGEWQVAIDQLKEIEPDVILLDLMMPEMDGFQFVAALQEHPAWSRIPVIVITARDLSAEDRRRLNSGVELILLKESFNPSDLVDRVRQLVAKGPTASGAGDCLVTRILYVEDNDDNVYMLKMRLELLEGFEVLVADNGETGCAQAIAQQPDVI